LALVSVVAQLLTLLASLFAPHPLPSASTVRVHAPGPPRLLAPRPYEAFDGLVTGVAPPGRRILRGNLLGRRFRVSVGPDGRFRARLRGLPLGEGELRLGPFAAAPVYSLPPGSLRPLRPPRLDARLERTLAAAGAASGPIAGVYIRAAAGAAGTLKLPVMLVALADCSGEPRDSAFWGPMVAVTRVSDNAAANRLLELIGGTEAGGAARMVALTRSLGLVHTSMWGGYELTSAAAAPPVTVVEQPPAAGKLTTAADMAALAAFVVDAAAGRGPLVRHGVSPHEARELLFLMLGAETPGLVSPATRWPVAHKIGWLEDARHDVAVVFGPRGPVVVSIFTSGAIDDAGVAALGERVTRAALRAARRPEERAHAPAA
jgi:hypothetical protein